LGLVPEGVTKQNACNGKAGGGVGAKHSRPPPNTPRPPPECFALPPARPGEGKEAGHVELSVAARDRQPAWREVAVAVRDGELVAYLVGASGIGARDLAPVRAHVAGNLPRYMIPRDYLWLDTLPRTPNGKLDRAALPAPERAGAGAGTESPDAAAVDGADPPGGADLTQVVAGIWREVFRVKEIGPDDTIFDLGGHSLTILQMIARIRETLGVEVPFDVFFDTPTIGGVVSSIEELQQE
jgi:acyl carrier protein